jgi:hypothetical protein
MARRGSYFWLEPTGQGGGEGWLPLSSCLDPGDTCRALDDGIGPQDKPQHAITGNARRRIESDHVSAGAPIDRVLGAGCLLFRIGP